LCDGIFERELKQGSVLRTKIQFADGTERNKFLIILNQDPATDPTLFFLTTSRLDFYQKHPNFNKDIICIKAGQLSFFPKETIIDCRNVNKKYRVDLKENFRKGVLVFAGSLPEETVEEMKRIIAQSFFIAKRDKDMILGVEGND